MEERLAGQSDDRDLPIQESAVFGNLITRPYAYQKRGIDPRTDHPFYTYDGTMCQPEVVSDTLSSCAVPVEDVAGELAGRPQRYLLTGVGGSYHASLVGAQFLCRVAGVQAEALESYEWLNAPWARDLSKTVLIAYSASGSTKETLAAVSRARSRGAWCLGITSQPRSTLEEVCHATLVAAGGQGYVFDYSSRLAVTLLLAVRLADGLGRPGDTLISVQEALDALPAVLRQALGSIERACQLVGRLWCDRRAVWCIGSGLAHSAALDTAMRFVETTTIPAAAFTLAHYLHCGIGATDQRLALLLFAPPGLSYGRMVDLARITQVLKVPSAAVVAENDSGMTGLVDEVIRVPGCHEIVTPFVYPLAGQLISYYAELARPGGNPDIRRTNLRPYARAFRISQSWIPD